MQVQVHVISMGLQKFVRRGEFIQHKVKTETLQWSGVRPYTSTRLRAHAFSTPTFNLECITGEGGEGGGSLYS